MKRETWLDQLAHELAARGVEAPEAAGLVVEAAGHLEETGVAPLVAFGSPARYAGLLVDALEPGDDGAARPLGQLRLRASGVRKRYRRRTVLDDVDLDLYDGEVVLLIGRNGCGKSTLLRILAGLLDPDAGEVTVNGSVGYAPQHGGLLDHLLPAEHFVLFGRARGLAREEAVQQGRRIAEQLGWDALNAPVAGRLSGGTRQKLNVVLAALGAPDLLLLDEPYQGLDYDSVQRFWELLWSWRDEGGAALVVSHMPEAVERADAVVELDRPRVVRAGERSAA
jgi:ABC-type multidrug transport system ATPase subunit